MDNDVFVLLDDCNATAQQPTSRLYTGFVREHRCTDPHTLDALWQQVEHDQRAGLHTVLFADYEWGCRLQQAGMTCIAPNDSSALRVLMFHTLQRLSVAAVSEWLTQRDGAEAPSPAGISNLHTDTDPARFDADIARIRALISQGETYQVNYTLRMHGAQFGSPVGLYRRLRAMQPVPFGALVALPMAAESTTASEVEWIVSASPELFVRSAAGQLTARPMKGTAPRHEDAQTDRQQADWLHRDAKNRAENVMIVDLLRNDLGRISTTGSVKVPALFSVETYKTVHQMTSTVESCIRKEVQFPDVLRALFPCGSITGAPKLHTMDLIAALESTPRGLYCGAIGWVDTLTADTNTGDFCLSVAIRTLLLGAPIAGLRPMTLGVGGGVVMDSVAQEEFAETQAKARFLTRMDPGFTLFETLRISRGRARNLDYHLRRLRGSAQALGFALDEATLMQALGAHLATLPSQQNFRLRLDLHHDGRMTLQHAAIAALPPGPARLLLSASPVPAQEAALLQHKTSLRTAYDTAIQKAVAHHAFDTVFVNDRGEVCEGARSTLLVQRDGRWYTPALDCGVLQGVMRMRMLQRYPAITEKTLPLQEVLSAQSLLVCSALRGLQRAEWIRDANGAVHTV